MTQLDFLDGHGAALLQQAHQRLEAYFGPPPARQRLEPLDQMVLSMLGARTYDAVSLEAFEKLRAHYPCWEDVRDGPQATVLALIDRVTYPENKVRAIQQALHMITRKCGRLDLGFLAHWDVGNAMAWLKALPGVGPKAAAATLNFSILNKKAMVVDTHHLRLLKRLRLVRKNASFDEGSDIAGQYAPQSWCAEDFDDHHTLLKRLGQTHCRHDNPDCGACPLSVLCSTGKLRQRARIARGLALSSERRPSLALQSTHSHPRPGAHPQMQALAPAASRAKTHHQPHEPAQPLLI